ncbi:MAG: hypothetical protein SGI77_19475 [Pirellulaceae bacterium]|nr:hypothetical protein [Pirellulaceae bacterium]
MKRILKAPQPCSGPFVVGSGFLDVVNDRFNVGLKRSSKLFINDPQRYAEPWIVLRSVRR